MSVKIGCFCALLVASSRAEEVTIYRDGWGVPHIYAKTDRALAFGFGYAQAQDRAEALLTNIARASGRLAARTGSDAVSGDFQQRLWKHRETAAADFEQMPPQVRDWVVSFAAGINHYLSNRSRESPSDSITATDVLALGRHLYWRAILEQLDTEYARSHSGNKPAVEGKGTLWGLSPERSARDAAMIAIDPSESWDAGSRFYEAHLHGSNVHAWGFTYPGLPLPVFGHNRTLGWGWIPGGPDVGDVYRITFESAASPRYYWDGRLRTAGQDTFHISVRNGRTSILTGQFTHLGPILHRTGPRGYAFRVPEAIEAGQITQLYDMIASKGFQDFYEALRSGQLGPATFLYGDRSGVLFYIQSGLVPIRPESVEWDRAVATDADSEWLGLHVQEDLVQILDPRPGWVVDAGTSPDRVTDYAPMTPDRFPDHVYNASPGTESGRSVRLRSLIGASPRMGMSEAFRIMMDTYVIGSMEWINALRFAIARHEPKLSSEQADAFEKLTAWDGRAEPDRMGPALYLSWRSVCEEMGRSIDDRSIELRMVLSEQTERALIDAFRTAVGRHKELYSHLQVRWREIHRHKRGERSWGIPGLISKTGSTIRDIRSTRVNVVDYGTVGQSAPTLILFASDGVKSYSAVPYGQSDNTASPHSWDQAEALFTKGLLKPTRFDTRPSDLKQKEVLRLPEDLFTR